MDWHGHPPTPSPFPHVLTQPMGAPFPLNSVPAPHHTHAFVSPIYLTNYSAFSRGPAMSVGLGSHTPKLAS